TADDHQADREAVGQARRDGDGRVAADVDGRGVGYHLQGAGQLLLAAGAGAGEHRGDDGQSRHDEHVGAGQGRVVGGGEIGGQVAGHGVIPPVPVIGGVAAGQRGQLHRLGQVLGVAAAARGVVGHEVGVVPAGGVRPVPVAVDHLGGGAVGG